MRGPRELNEWAPWGLDDWKCRDRWNFIRGNSENYSSENAWTVGIRLVGMQGSWDLNECCSPGSWRDAAPEDGNR